VAHNLEIIAGDDLFRHPSLLKFRRRRGAGA
jgi:hypothetical protein